MHYLLKKVIGLIWLNHLLNINAQTTDVVVNSTGLTWAEAVNYCLSKNLTLTSKTNLSWEAELKTNVFWLSESIAVTPWIEQIGCLSIITQGGINRENINTTGLCLVSCNKYTTFAYKNNYPISECACLEDSFPWRSNLTNCNRIDSKYQVFSRSNVSVLEPVNITENCLINRCVDKGPGSSPNYTAYGFSAADCSQNSNISYACRDDYTQSQGKNVSEAEFDCISRNSSLISDFDQFCQTYGGSNNTQSFLWSTHRRFLYYPTYKKGDDPLRSVRCQTGQFVKSSSLRTEYKLCSDKMYAFVCESDDGEYNFITIPRTETTQSTNFEITTPLTSSTDKKENTTLPIGTDQQKNSEVTSQITSSNQRKTLPVETDAITNAEVTTELTSSRSSIFWQSTGKLEVITLTTKAETSQVVGLIIWGSLSTTAFIACLVLFIIKFKLRHKFKLSLRMETLQYQEMEPTT